MMALGGKAYRVLMIVENLPCPFDRRVWQEACTLSDHGFEVSIICPTGKGYERTYEVINRVHIYRHPLPTEGNGVIGYAAEYAAALWWEFLLAWKVFFTRGFDVIHACNPPDNICLVAGCFKFLFRKKFLFDHHDITPELYEAKFGRKDIWYRLMVAWERLTFRLADVSIATNESYRRIAIERGGMDPAKVFVVRSGPSLERLKIIEPVASLKRGRRFLVGYVGVMGKQEGVDYLLRAIRYLVHEAQRHDVHFGLVGSGPELEDLKKLTADYQLEDFVTFTGRVPDQQLLEMLNTADVCVNPDVYNELNDKSTMNKIMEYMAVGKAIVQFDLTEGRFSAGEASLYAKPNDERDLAEKIVFLLDRPELRDAMGRMGRARIEQVLEWKYEAPKLLRAYQAVMSPYGHQHAVSPVTGSQERSQVGIIAKEALFRSGALRIARSMGRNRSAMPILQYHSVSSDGQYRSPTIAVHPMLFDRQMAYLARHYRVISIDAAMDCVRHQRPFPDKAVAITFDDGYLDNYVYAYPVLKKYGLTATFFVTVGPVMQGQRFWVSWVRKTIGKADDLHELFRMGLAPRELQSLPLVKQREATITHVTAAINRLGLTERGGILKQLEEFSSCMKGEAGQAVENEEMLSPAQVREMAEGGMTIGSHTITHPNLPSLSLPEASHELMESKTLLESLIGGPVTHLAYPGGPDPARPDFTEDISKLAQEVGYRSASTSLRGSVGLDEKLHELRRYDINDSDGLSGLAFKLERHRLGPLFASRPSATPCL